MPPYARKRRLRKKYQIGEFTPLVLTLEARFQPPLDTQEATTLWDALIDLVESRNLGAFGASGDSHVSWFITGYAPRPRKRNGAWNMRNVAPTQEDVFAFLAWAETTYPTLGIASKLVNFSAKIERLK